ncbi:MAG: 2-oxoacid:acceptor oxidoreductase family protein [Oscillospiraceae bacterium]|jgi:Pyruvate/2-oxoacid:ferredoxin oxidoreductase gamma subunit|nr:2-oxoacid:acceptor oxidoreductase family protein [Oscillospiraceae bacterium]
MKEFNILIAGSGGQGVQTIGKLMTEIGMEHGFEVSFIPSYGPEMRGGTSNCGVNISTEPIASPLVVTPTQLVALNLPSLDKFETSVVPGGSVIYDTDLIGRAPARTDVTYYGIPFTTLAEQLGVKANMLVSGKLLAVTGFCDPDGAESTIRALTAKRPAFFEPNMKALRAGFAL